MLDVQTKYSQIETSKVKFEYEYRLQISGMHFLARFKWYLLLFEKPEIHQKDSEEIIHILFPSFFCVNQDPFLTTLRIGLYYTYSQPLSKVLHCRIKVLLLRDEINIYNQLDSEISDIYSFYSVDKQAGNRLLSCSLTNLYYHPPKLFTAKSRMDIL